MFETLFKYPPDVFQQGQLVFEPTFGGMDGLALAGVAVFLVGANLLLASRARRLGAVRVVTLGLLQALFVAGALALLARPAMEVATLAPGANTVAVLVDASESMGFTAEQGPGTRLEAARALAQDNLLPALSRSSDVVTFVFGDGARRTAGLADVAAVEPHTRLLDAIENVLAGFQGTPLAAVVVITDGADNGSRNPEIARLGAAGVPVHTVGVGPQVLGGEVQISAVSLPADVAPDSRVVAEVTLEHAASGPAVVKVFDGARLVTARELLLDVGEPVRRVPVTFDSGPGGIRELSFAVEPPQSDRLSGNNRLDRLLTVSERQRRVLYLEGEPRWEYKFIRRALAGDRVVKLTSWLRTTQNKTYRQDVDDPDELADGFPATRQALFAFDVVVLGSLAATDLNDERHGWLETFVADRGGSLLALGGRQALTDGGWDVTPLAAALPVRLERGAGPAYRAAEGRVRPTAAGQHSPITQLVDGEGADPWASLPALGDHQRLGALKPAAVVLLEAVVDGQPHPLLVTQPYGLGTGAVLATGTTWRWRMGTPPDDPRHTLFWRQLLRQLGESARQRTETRFAVENGTISVQWREQTAAFLPSADTAAAVTISGPGVNADRLELAPSDTPGVLHGRYRTPRPGVYRLDLAIGHDDPTITRFVRVGDQRPEHFDAAQNVPLLRRIAEVTGGRYWRPEEAGGIVDALTFGSAGVKRTERYPLWDMPVAFLLLLAIKTGEWVLRRRWGRI